MKGLAIIGLFSVSFATCAQTDNVHLQLDSLIQKLHQAINLQKSLEIEEIKGVYKLTPWHFVPSLNYDFINNNYYVTISSGALVTNMINRRQETRRLSAIERRYANQEKTSEIKLKSLYISLIQKLANIQLSHEILLNDVEIFQIKSQEYAANEIDTETFLKDKSGILNKIKDHNTEVSDIQRYMLEIEQLTEYEINIDLSRLFVSPVSIVPTTKVPTQ